MIKKFSSILASRRSLYISLATIALAAMPGNVWSGSSDSSAGPITKSKGQAPGQSKLNSAAYRAGEVLVLMATDPDKSGKDQSQEVLRKIESVSAGKVRKQTRLNRNHQVVSVVLPAGKAVEDVLAEDWSKKDSRILLVEPDWRVSKMVTPNDPRFSSMWGLNNTGQYGGKVDADIDAPEAWNITTGSPDIIVGIIDTGLDYNHPDLAGNIWTNAQEAAGIAGVDDDGNGYIDDIHGYDFVMDDGDPMDADGHGTHVAGTIGAVGNNNLGVVGVNWQCKVMACRFLDASGSGYTSDAISAINYAVDNGARILNNSWGGGSYSALLAEAINYANDNGVLFVVAAGNSGENNDTADSYPADYDIANVLSVAATNSSDGLADFSNYGVKTVHLAAPGTSILSSVPTFYSVFNETFESALSGGFIGTQMTATGTWATIADESDLDNIVAVTDEYYPYSADSDSYLVSGPMDTRDKRGLSVQYLYRGEITSGDYLRVEVWDGSSWVVIAELTNVYTSSDGLFDWNCHDIPDSCRNDSMRVRFHWTTDSIDLFDGYGLDIDDVMVQYISDNYTSAYANYSGTSMATPHVSGAAALLLASDPGMAVYQLKSRLMIGCDKIEALSDEVISGGRLNVNTALTMSDELALVSPVGGEYMAVGNTYWVRWLSVGGGSTVSIHLENDAGTVSQIIGQDVADSGEFQWTLANDLALGDDYRIRIEGGLLSVSSPEPFRIGAARNYHTELFDGDFDLENTRLFLTPQGDSYAGCIENVNSFNSNPAGGLDLALGDDDFAYLSFDKPFEFNGQSYDDFYVGSNGYVTFDDGDISLEVSLGGHFAMKRISALLNDLDPSEGGEVSVRRFTDHIAITWDGVPEFGYSNTNNFQIEMYYDGGIAITWLGIESQENLVGVSYEAGSIPADYAGSNISSYDVCGFCKEPAGDLNGDCQVNILDLAIIMNNWLVDCVNDPQNAACN